MLQARGLVVRSTLRTSSIGRLGSQARSYRIHCFPLLLRCQTTLFLVAWLFITELDRARMRCLALLLLHSTHACDQPLYLYLIVPFNFACLKRAFPSSEHRMEPCVTRTAPPVSSLRFPEQQRTDLHKRSPRAAVMMEVSVQKMMKC
jgi:hypothetical protein